MTRETRFGKPTSSATRAWLSIAGIFLGGAMVLWAVVLSGNAVVIAAGSALVVVGASLLVNFVLRRSRES